MRTENREKYLKIITNLAQSDSTKGRQIRIKDEYLKLIVDTAYDYDGRDYSIDGLKEVIDQVVHWAKLALENDDEETIYDGDKGGKHYNILGELIAEDRRP